MSIKRENTENVVNSFFKSLISVFVFNGQFMSLAANKVKSKKYKDQYIIYLFAD